MELEKKWKTIFIVIFVAFEVLLVTATSIQLKNPLKDIKSNSFKTYTGVVKYVYEKSSRYTDVYQLKGADGLYIEADRGVIEYTTNPFSAKVVYGENSKQLVDIEIYN